MAGMRPGQAKGPSVQRPSGGGTVNYSILPIQLNAGSKVIYTYPLIFQSYAFDAHLRTTVNGGNPAGTTSARMRFVDGAGLSTAWEQIFSASGQYPAGPLLFIETDINSTGTGETFCFSRVYAETDTTINIQTIQKLIRQVPPPGFDYSTISVQIEFSAISQFAYVTMGSVFRTGTRLTGVVS